MADIFEHVDQEEFEDFPDFHKSLGRALREADWWPSDSTGRFAPMLGYHADHAFLGWPVYRRVWRRHLQT